MLPVEVSQEINQFLHWLTAAKPGGTYLYHRGLLAVDRQRVYYEYTATGGRRPVAMWREPVHTVARLALGAHHAGLVYLTQCRRRAGEYAYIATRSREPVAGGPLPMLQLDLLRGAAAELAHAA